MSARLYFAANGPAPTTAAQVSVTTGTAIKTLQQIATPSTKSLTIVEWGISFDGSGSGNNVKVELLQTDVAATVTAYVAGDVNKYNGPNDEATVMTLGTAASGYTASAEGTITATRVLDLQYIPLNGSWMKQWPLGREPEVPVSKFLRVRVTSPTAVPAYSYVIWEE